MKNSNHDIFESKFKLNFAAKKLSWTLIARLLPQTFSQTLKTHVFVQTSNLSLNTSLFNNPRDIHNGPLQMRFHPAGDSSEKLSNHITKIEFFIPFYCSFVANTFIGFFFLIKVAKSWIFSLFCLWYFPSVDLWSCKKMSRWISHKSLDSSGEVVTEEQI